ncbi:hypothetical protein KF913_13435 [Candidatus Obscuribacterales bacterium]|nr:hypothetical protein [Candidatus Obscuribacterales bacterium]
MKSQLGSPMGYLGHPVAFVPNVCERRDKVLNRMSLFLFSPDDARAREVREV